MIEHVPEREPVLLHQSDKAINGTIVRVKTKLTQCTKLTRSVPAIGAVYEYMRMLYSNLTSDYGSSIK